ncbi:MAG: NDP-sugar synthase [Vicinamibacteria bacterium]
MKAIVFADRAADSLLPLTRETCAALLPVAAKPLLEHALESLALADVREVAVVASPFAEQVEALAGTGERWGLRLETVLSRAEDTPARVLARLGGAPAGEGLLVLRGDAVRSPFLAGFLGRARAMEAPVVAASIDGAHAGVCLFRGGDGDGLPGDPAAPWALPAAAIEMEGAASNRCGTLAAYHRANLDAAAGRYPGLLVPGRPVAVGVTAGRRTRLPLRAVRDWPVFAGSRCEVHAEAELLADVVLSDDVVVDRRATLRSTVVLPHTYVGELVELQDAIVCRNDLVRVDTGATVRVTDAFLLGDLRRSASAGPLANGLQRAAGLAALVLSLPLWPLALAASFAADPRGPLRRVRLRGNRRRAGEASAEFDAWRGATRLPVLRDLFLLPAVVAGHLRLVGVPPLTPEAADARTEEWERVRDGAPVGLVGPSQLTLAGAPLEERLMMDAFYAQRRNGREDARWLARGALALFSRRAWSAGARA